MFTKYFSWNGPINHFSLVCTHFIRKDKKTSSWCDCSGHFNLSIKTCLGMTWDLSLLSIIVFKKSSGSYKIWFCFSQESLSLISDFIFITIIVLNLVWFSCHRIKKCHVQDERKLISVNTLNKWNLMENFSSVIILCNFSQKISLNIK